MKSLRKDIAASKRCFRGKIGTDNRWISPAGNINTVNTPTTSAEKLLMDSLDKGGFATELLNGDDPLSDEALQVAIGNLSKVGRLLVDSTLVQALVEHMPELALQPAQANRLYFVDLLYEQLATVSGLDARIVELLGEFKPLLARQILASDQFIKTSRHPLRQALDTLTDRAIGWHDGLGSNGDKLLLQFEDYIESVNGLEVDVDELPAHLVDQQQQIDKIFARYEKLQQRVCDSALGAMESQVARRFVDKYLNALFEGRQLPVAAVDFLQGEWRNSLQMLLLREGQQGSEWQSVTALTNSLVLSLLPQKSDQDKQKLLQLIPSFRPALRKHLLSVSSEDDKDDLLDTIEELHMLVLKGETLPAEDITPLSSLNTEGVITSISDAVSAEAANLQAGQWVLYNRENGSQIKAKLALLLADTAQMLFVNVLGAKCLEKSVEEFGFALSSKKAQLLNSQQVFSKTIARAVEQLIRQYQKQLREPPTPSAEQTEKLKQESLEKARAEAERLREQQEAEQAAIVEEESAELPESERGQVEKQVQELTIGAWVSLENRFGDRVSAKVAVIYKSTDKAVFVDQNGVKVGEYIKSDFVELIMQGKAEILKQSDNFENSLARVIKTLRKD